MEDQDLMLSLNGARVFVPADFAKKSWQLDRARLIGEHTEELERLRVDARRNYGSDEERHEVEEEIQLHKKGLTILKRMGPIMDSIPQTTDRYKIEHLRKQLLELRREYKDVIGNTKTALTEGV